MRNRNMICKRNTRLGGIALVAGMTLLASACITARLPMAPPKPCRLAGQRARTCRHLLPGRHQHPRREDSKRRQEVRLGGIHRAQCRWRRAARFRHHESRLPTTGHGGTQTHGSRSGRIGSRPRRAACRQHRPVRRRHGYHNHPENRRPSKADGALQKPKLTKRSNTGSPQSCWRTTGNFLPPSVTRPPAPALLHSNHTMATGTS